MSRRTIRLIAFILLGIFIIWLMYAIVPLYIDEEEIKDDKGNNSLYEPKFKDEGDLYIISERDTLFTFDVELADTPEEIQYGMMYRQSIEENQAMLFYMGEETEQSFWMKNTYVSLDIIYINDNNEIVSIQKNAKPLNSQSLPSGVPASKVLEVRGGLTDKYNFKNGDRVILKKN